MKTFFWVSIIPSNSQYAYFLATSAPPPSVVPKPFPFPDLNCRKIHCACSVRWCQCSWGHLAHAPRYLFPDYSYMSNWHAPRLVPAIMSSQLFHNVPIGSSISWTLNNKWHLALQCRHQLIGESRQIHASLSNKAANWPSLGLVYSNTLLWRPRYQAFNNSAWCSCEMIKAGR